MQPTFTEMKSAARRSLKNRWPEAMAVTMLLAATFLLDTVMQYTLMSIFKVGAVWSPFSPTDVPLYSVIASISITVFSGLFSLFVKYPLFFGVMRWFWLVTGGGDPGIGELFYYFSSGRQFRKSVALSFGLLWRLVIASVVCFLPYILCSIFTQPDVYNYFGYAMPIWLSGMYPLTDVLELFGFIFLLLWTTVYTLFYTVLYSEPRLSAHQTLRETTAVSRGQRMRFAGFSLSFFGWALLCLCVLPLLFVLPYAMASYAVYGRETYRFKHRPTA